MVFDVYKVNKDKNEDRCLGTFEYFEDAYEVICKEREKLNEGDTLETWAGQKVFDDESYAERMYEFDVDDCTTGKFTKTLIKKLNSELRQCVHSQKVCKSVPKRIIRKKGDKEIDFDKYQYICRECHGKIGDYNHWAEFVRKPAERKYKVKKTEFQSEEEIPKQVLMCPWCYNVLENCDCNRWPEFAISIDEGIFPIISIMNKKGYFTKFCCEGHEDSPDMYISPIVNYGYPIPDGWYKDAHNTLRFPYKRRMIDNLSFEDNKKAVLKSLKEWAESLPQLNAFEVEKEV